MKKLLIACFSVVFLGFSARMASQADPSPQVIFFLSPTCKICQFYTLEMQTLYKDYAGLFAFRAVMPGTLVSDSSATAFRETYGIPFPVSRDVLNEHMSMNATVTPEVFVVNGAGEVVYHGRIDDAYVAIGKRRTIVKHHELRDVLEAISTGMRIETKNTPAVGCIIEKD